MNFRLVTLSLVLSGSLAAQPDRIELPIVTVYSPLVANQEPVATFAMPVSSLRFEPRVDVQARNFAEGQADVSVRGGIFESTGFKVGASTLFDPQTGHYFAEIPVAPAMLGAPDIVTGAELATRMTNAMAGSVIYPWRKIRSGGVASIGGGEFGLTQADFYQGFVAPPLASGRALAADVAWAHSDSDGAVAYGDHVFDRVAGRVQLAGNGAQTDLFAAYQSKFFGWPNLYTPFNSNETEAIQTVLLAINHRVDWGAGEFFEAGAYYRRNKDDYAFDRFAPVGPVHPFQHTTWVRGASAEGRRVFDALALNVHAEVISDAITSTSLTFGRYRSRTLGKIAVVPEKTWSFEDGSRVIAKAGLSYDRSNRDGGAVSPILELAREWPGRAIERLHLSYSEATQLPTYTALKSNSAAGLFRGNQGLGRSTSRNLEAGVRGAANGWTGEAAVFYRRDDDLVDWTFRRGVTARSANAVDIETTGVEFVAQRSWRAIDLVLGYTWLTKDADYRGAAVDASFYALNFAEHRWTLAMTARLGRGWELRMDNEARVQAENPLRMRGGERPLLTSLGIAYRPAALGGLSFSVQADNVWDSEYQEVPAVPATPRQVSGSVAYAW